MRSFFASMLLLCACVQSGWVQAEIFLTQNGGDRVVVDDHLRTGVSRPSREIFASQGNFRVPTRIQVYTGKQVGSDERVTELWVCDEFNNQIVRFPIDAEGEAEATSKFFWPDALHGCTEFLVHRDEIFMIGPDTSEVEVYPNASGAPDRKRRLQDDFAGLFELRVDGDRLYALTSFDDIVAWTIDPEGGDQQATILLLASNFQAPCRGPWEALEVHDGFAYVLSRPNPPGIICVIELESKRLIRTLSLDGIVEPRQLRVSGNELSVAALEGVYTFDLLAGGEVSPKRSFTLAQVRNLWVTQESEPVAQTFELALEDPVNGAVHSGIGNLRGWAVASEGIAKVDIFINGQLFQAAPYGGNRDDVGAVFPDVDGSSASGFSLAYNYGALGAGEHTVLARAETRSGGLLEASATFTTTRPGQEFIPGADAIDLSGASCSINQGRSIRIEDITIDGGGPWDAFLEWQPAAQAFEAQTYIFNADGI